MLAWLLKNMSYDRIVSRYRSSHTQEYRMEQVQNIALVVINGECWVMLMRLSPEGYVALLYYPYMYVSASGSLSIHISLIHVAAKLYINVCIDCSILSC
jgi:hypothetical protein